MQVPLLGTGVQARGFAFPTSLQVRLIVLVRGHFQQQNLRIKCQVLRPLEGWVIVDIMEQIQCSRMPATQGRWLDSPRSMKTE